MAYTIDEQNQLDGLFAARKKAQETYAYEADMNSRGHSEQVLGENRGGVFYFPFSAAQTDRSSFYTWLSQSDTALANAIVAKNSAEKSYADFVNQLNQKYITNNPVIQQTEITSAASSASNTAASIAANAANIELQKIKSASVQGTTKYLIYGGIALVLIIVGIVIFRKKYNL